MLVNPPNIEDAVLEATEAGLAAVRDEGCPKPAGGAASPKMDLKFWTGGLLLSAADVIDTVVVATAKMGLNPEASKGLVLLADPEMLAETIVEVTGLEAEEAEGALIWPVSPNRPVAAAATGGVLLEPLET